MHVIRKVAIANRGEIAVRIITACRELGIRTVLLYSAADQNSKAVRISDEKICIGPPESLKSYLNIEAIVTAALSVRADAIHPGYGFLSENPGLAIACENKGLIFIGPRANQLELFGDKTLTRQKAQACGIPVLPGDLKCQIKQAQNIGFPVVIKASHGGGGRGLRVVHSEKNWNEALAAAKREAKNAFDSETVFIEKYLPDARHIEVQVFADASGEVHYLFDRDCSIQRNHQKIVEEAPAESIPLAIRQQMKQAALELIRSVGYRQAGTVEFLYQDGKFYFMEVNPRLQVECPVTEMILGVDLVKAQILTAAGHFPFISQSFTPKGHSIQCRIYAEDMQKQIPTFGCLGSCVLPYGAGRRVDVGFESGDEISEFYDSMIGKIIVWDENRTRALKRMKLALSETIIFGVKTNISFLQDLLSHRQFITSQTNTRFVQEVFLKSWQERNVDSLDPQVINLVVGAFSKQKNLLHSYKKTNPWTDFYKKT